MTRSEPRRFWRDPRWWVSLELGIAASAVVLAIFLHLAQPTFTGFEPLDTTPVDVVAGLGLLVGIALMLRLARPRV